ncbi:hypothetical protein M5D96_012716 [Drosophila gunungcola]|uniref:Uncharacterized protein n=1 Tax=Drosophila gunungcola TaxID=103775 RepID=A0A9P9YDJ8_9MUSC|nr:hypothetical protein M5D96_012716 [Drosophila gunungcola]
MVTLVGTFRKNSGSLVEVFSCFLLLKRSRKR